MQLSKCLQLRTYIGLCGITERYSIILNYHSNAKYHNIVIIIANLTPCHCKNVCFSACYSHNPDTFSYDMFYKFNKVDTKQATWNIGCHYVVN